MRFGAVVSHVRRPAPAASAPFALPPLPAHFFGDAPLKQKHDGKKSVYIVP